MADTVHELSWQIYRDRVIAHARVVGIIQACLDTGLSKTTIYRWLQATKETHEQQTT